MDENKLGGGNGDSKSNNKSDESFDITGYREEHVCPKCFETKVSAVAICDQCGYRERPIWQRVLMFIGLLLLAPFVCFGPCLISGIGLGAMMYISVLCLCIYFLAWTWFIKKYW